jgi:hypothetical protein
MGETIPLGGVLLVHGNGVISETNAPRRVEGGQDVVEGMSIPSASPAWLIGFEIYGKIEDLPLFY